MIGNEHVPRPLAMMLVGAGLGLVLVVILATIQGV